MISAEPILDLIDGFRRSKTLFTAVRLGIFDGERPAGAAVDRLCDACVALGLLEKRGTEYINKPVAERFFRKSSRHSLVSFVNFTGTAHYSLWAGLEQALMEGGEASLQAFRKSRSLDQMRSDRQDFIRGMHQTGTLSSACIASAFDLSGFKNAVDLGGATGHLGMALKERYPRMAVALFDLPHVIALARPYVDSSIELIAGNFFKDALPKADLFALSRVLHNLDDKKCGFLLSRIHAALRKEGAVLIGERLLKDDRTEPVAAHMQSLNMLLTTGGRERTANEFAELLGRAGFQDFRTIATPSSLHAIVAMKRCVTAP